MTTFNTFLRALDRDDAGLCFVDGDTTTLSHRDLGDRVCGNARHFAACGVKRGDRVALHLHTDLEHVVSALALMALGAIPMSIKPPRPGETTSMATIVERYGVRFCAGDIVAPRGAASLRWDPSATSTDRLAIEAVTPETLAFVQFSSGSTSDPKAVPIRHESLVDNTRAIAQADGRTRSSIGGCVVPLCHDMGWLGLLSCFELQHVGNLCTTQRFLRKPLAFLSSMPRCDTIAMPDFLLRYLTRAIHRYRQRVAPDLLGRIGTIFCGAEPIRRDTIDALIEAGEPHGFDPSCLVFAYGLAEATLIATARRFDDLERSFESIDGRSVANVGRPIAGMEMKMGPTIRLRGPSVVRGYLDAPSHAGGWHDTGDVGRMRDGELFVVGRANDTIIIHGENLYPQDLEAVALRVPGVRECVVASEGDAYCLFVVPSGEFSPDDLNRAMVTSFGAAPSAMMTGTAGEIPRTTSGKPRRQALLARIRGVAA